LFVYRCQLFAVVFVVHVVANPDEFSAVVAAGEQDDGDVGPIPVGVNKFIFEADAPDVKRIPTSEMLGVTVKRGHCGEYAR
jgi:hypothetical protein